MSTKNYTQWLLRREEELIKLCIGCIFNENYKNCSACDKCEYDNEIETIRKCLSNIDMYVINKCPEFWSSLNPTGER